MNPFHENKKTLTIEMPDKVKRLNISSGAGSVRISDVDLENTSIQSINGEVVIKNSNLDALEFQRQIIVLLILVKVTLKIVILKLLLVRYKSTRVKLNNPYF